VGKGLAAIALLLLCSFSIAEAHHGPGDHNCSDFTTWESAQAFYLEQGGPEEDPHRLDADGDGIACEGFTNAPQNPATATARAILTGTPAGSSPTSTPTRSATPTGTATRTATATPSRSATPQVSRSPTLTSPPVATATLMPASQVCVAYVFRHDLVTASSYQGLLNGAGIRADLVQMSELRNVDLGRYSAVVVGPETGDGELWGDPSLSLANHITAWKLPVIGLGTGGSSFFGAIDLDLAWRQGMVGPATGALVIDPGHPFWQQPTNLPVASGGSVQLYTSESPAIAIQHPDPPSYLALVARANGSPQQYLVIGQYGRFWLWGFDHGPATMTTTGRDLFVNLVRNMPSASCGAPAASPTLPTLTSPTATATATPSATPGTATATRSTTPSTLPTAPPPGAVGGRGLALSSEAPILTWSAGSVQTAYLIVRWVVGGDVTLLPPQGMLPAGSTSFQDTSPIAGSVVCYFVLPLGGGPPSSFTALGRSDLLCVAAGTRTGESVAPARLQLNESVFATVSWQASQVALAPNRLLVLPLDGAAPQLLPIDPGPGTHLFDTRGVPTCVQLQAVAGSTTVGATNLLCGFPGTAVFASG
jgi:hypothetical protein